MAVNLDHYLEWLTGVLSHSERFQIVGLIAESPRPAAAIATATGLADEVVEGHLQFLRSLGIVAVEGAGETAAYRLDLEGLRRAHEDLGAIPADVRHLQGRLAPDFRLQAADGREIALVDCLARGPAIVWFSRGLSCPICRRQRAQLTRGYSAFRALDAEVLEITPTPIDRASRYFSNYDLAFPYLCDPEGTTAAVYGVKRGRSEPLLLLRVAVGDWLGSKEITHELLYGPQLEPIAQEAEAGAEDGFFIVDPSGMIRFADIGPYQSLPSNREIELLLQDAAR